MLNITVAGVVAVLWFGVRKTGPPLVLALTDTLKVNGVLELVTVTDCACGNPPPGCVVKVSDDGDTDSRGLVLTSRFTGIFVVGFEAPGALIWMFPEQLVGLFKPAVLMETLIEVGVEPFAEV